MHPPGTVFSVLWGVVAVLAALHAGWMVWKRRPARDLLGLAFLAALLAGWALDLLGLRAAATVAVALAAGAAAAALISAARAGGRGAA